MSKLLVKRSSVAGKIPTTTDLDFGEIAINTIDGYMYFKRLLNSVETIVRITMSTELTSHLQDVTHGGTGLTSVAQGDLLYGSGTNVLSKLPGGTDDYILRMKNNVPSWTKEVSLDGYAKLTDINWTNVSNALGSHTSTPNLVFKTDGYGSGNLTRNTQIIQNRIFVGKAGDAHFYSISDAINYVIATGVSFENPWEIDIAPGTYIEPPMTVVPGINVIGGSANRIDTVFVVAQDPNEDLFTCYGGYLTGFRAMGVTSATKCLFRCATQNTLVIVHGIAIQACSNGIIVSNGAVLLATNSGVSLNGPNQNITGDAIRVSGAGTVASLSGAVMQVPVALLPYYTVNPIQNGIHVADGARCSIGNASFSMPALDLTSNTIFAEGGSTTILIGCEFVGCVNALHIGASGSNTSITVQGSNFEMNVLNANIESSTGAIYGVVSADVSNTYTVPGAIVTGVYQFRGVKETQFRGECKYIYSNGDSADLAKYLYNFCATGCVTGGKVTALNGLNVAIEAGTGWITEGNNVQTTQDVSWDGYSLTLPANSTSYIVYDNPTDTVKYTESEPGQTSILLGLLVTNNDSTVVIHETRNILLNPLSLVHTYIMDTRKFWLKSGLATTKETSSAIKVNSGSYYRGISEIPYSSPDGYSHWNYLYGTNGVNIVYNSSTVDLTKYDSSGTLTTMTDGYYRIDTLYLTSDGYLWTLYGNAQYATSELSLIHI